MRQKKRTFFLVKETQKLMFLQILLLITSTLVSAFVFGHYMALGIFLGGSIAIVPIFFGMLFFMRLPEIIGAKTFYSVMLLYEVFKWLINLILGAYFVNYLYSAGMADALVGVVIGFILCYFAHFLMYLIN